MDELDERFRRLGADVESKVRQPSFDVIRSRHRRRVRNQRVATGAVALVAVLAGYGAATKALNEDERPFDTTAVQEYFPPPTGEFGARDVSFFDDDQGWALGTRCDEQRCEMAVSRTIDGGGTWSPPARFGPQLSKDVLRTSTDPSSGAARSVRFVDPARGYAFNPALYATTDGGRTWVPVPVEGQVVAVAVDPAGKTPWVLTRGCPPDEGAPCRARAYRVEGARLSPVTTQPPAEGPTFLLRLTPDRVWLLSYGGDRQALVRSEDRGIGWLSTGPPCEEYDHQHFSAYGSSLWVVCTTLDGDRNSRKQVYVSDDGGLTWELRGSPDPRGVTNDVKAVSSTEAFLSSSHGDLLRTTDGGRTWTSVVGNGGYINLEFPSAEQGWFFGPDGALWRYRDGRAERVEGPR